MKTPVEDVDLEHLVIGKHFHGVPDSAAGAHHSVVVSYVVVEVGAERAVVEVVGDGKAFAVSMLLLEEAPFVDS